MILLYRLEYVFSRILAFFLALLPISLSSWIAKRAGDLAFFLMPRRREIALSNIQMVFGNSMSRKKKRTLARQSFQHVALSIIELFIVDKILKDADQRFEFQGKEHMDAAFAQGKGVLFIISHLGSWEYLAFFPYLLNRPLSAVVKSIKNPYLNNAINNLRRKMGYIPLPKKLVTKKILYELKQNHTIAILLDQWAGSEGIWASFFGQLTSTTSLPARLAKKTGAALIAGYCIRTAAGKYTIQFQPMVPLQGEEATWERKTTQALNHLLEEKIREHPEQWLWTHKRWKPKPQRVREA